MKKESTSKQKDNRNFMAAAVSLILAAALFAMDLYILLNKPANVLGITGTTALMLIWIYFFVRSVFQEMEKNRQETKAYLEALLKSEKAFFLMQRKFEDELHQIEEYSKLPSEQIITAQKAIAKLTINRIRENTDALLDSNDQLLDKMDALEQRIPENGNMSGSTEEKTGESADESKALSEDVREKKMEELEAGQREMADALGRIELMIKEEIADAIGSISQLQSGIQDSIRQETNTIADRVSALNAEISPELKSTERTIIPADTDNERNEILNTAAEPLSNAVDLSVDEAVNDAADLKAEADSVMPETMSENLSEAVVSESDRIIAATDMQSVGELSSNKEISSIGDVLSSADHSSVGEAEESSLTGETESLEEMPLTGETESLEEMPLTGETESLEEIPLMGETESLEEIPFEEELIVDSEEPVPEFISSDSYKESKKEVDSLLASLQDLDLNIGTEEKTSLNDQISLSEELSREEPAAVKESEAAQNQTVNVDVSAAKPTVKPAAANPQPAVKPKAPDLSNPNKMMTPDEIAALLASM